uniref:MARVEL domain-containing protein n=1 Tax=Setaria digitata TaxID=48799 RepID=A0A915Q2I3_9BILA
MSSTVRYDMYTRAEPNGATVTTTTKTTNDHLENREYYFGRGPLNRTYCCQPAGILRILQIIIGLLIISSIVSVYGPGPFKGILFGQTFLLIFAGIAVCFSFIFHIVFLFELHKTHLDFWPWKISDFMFSLTACSCYIILGFIEAYYSTGAWSNICNEIDSDGNIYNHCRTIYEWVFASVMIFYYLMFSKF